MSVCLSNCSDWLWWWPLHRSADQTIEINWLWVNCSGGVDSAEWKSDCEWRWRMLLSSAAADISHLGATSKSCVISGTPGCRLSTSSSADLSEWRWQRGTSSTDCVTAAGASADRRRVTDRPANRAKPVPVTRHTAAEMYQTRCHSLSVSCQKSSTLASSILIYNAENTSQIHPLWLLHRHTLLLARDSMLSALYAIANPSVCLSVRLSHGWISQKRLNVSLKFFHHLIGPTF